MAVELRNGVVTMPPTIGGKAEININELADNIAAAQTVKSKEYIEKISVNNEKVVEIEKLREDTTAFVANLQKLTNDLRSNVGSAAAKPNALNGKINIPKQFDGAVTMTLSPMAKASKADYAINVMQVARVDRVRSGFRCNNPNEAIGFSGSLVMNGYTFAITNDTTLNELVNQINSISSDVGVSASLVALNTGSDYVLELTANDYAEPIDFDAIAGSIDMQNGDGFQFSSISTPVDELAGRVDTIESGLAVENADAPLGFVGTLVINNKKIVVTAESTLNTVVAAINKQTKSNVVARINTIGGTPNTYTLLLTGTIQDVPINLNGTAGTQNLQGADGLRLPEHNTDSDTLIAKFMYNDSPEIMTRKTNTIDDLISGVSLQFQFQSTKDTIFSIQEDRTQAFDAITALVDSYNVIVDRINEHRKMLPDGKTPDPSAKLYGADIIDSIEQILQGFTRLSPLGSVEGDYLDLADIGLSMGAVDPDAGTVDLNRKLILNKQQLTSAIYDNDFEKIVKLFGNYFQSSNNDFKGFKMPDDLSPIIGEKTVIIAGKNIAVEYVYDVGASSNGDFELRQPTQSLGEEVAGKTVTLTYKNVNGIRTATLSGLAGQTDVSIDVVGATIAFPKDSIYAGLVLEYTEALPAPGEEVTSILTLPEYKATLSMAGRPDVVVHGVQNDHIQLPAGSIYAGLEFGYIVSGNVPLGFGARTRTTLTLTEGITINAEKLLTQAVARKSPGADSIPTSMFDIEIDKLLKDNDSSQRQIDMFDQMAEQTKESMSARSRKYYEISQKAKWVDDFLDFQLASMKEK